MKEKTMVCNNLIDADKILELSKEKIPEEDLSKINKLENTQKETTIFINVGRHQEKQKKLSRLIEAATMLKKDNMNFKIIFIGDGPETEEYKKQVKNNQLENNIIFLGKKQNPYPYFKIADCVVLTSDYEGYPVVFLESFILEKPIITTKVSDYKEVENKYGFVTEKDTKNIYDIEIILVNDGSQDGTEKIAKKYQEQYPQKIKYLEKENGGLSDARNYAIPYAKGEYVAFLDSDDYVETNMYQEMYEIAKKQNSDMVECNFIWEYPNKSRIDIGTVYNDKHEMLEKIRVVAWNKLIKREILEKSKVQFPKGYRYEDVEFTYKLIPFLEKVSFCKTPMIHYIQREGSISNVQNKRNAEIFDVMQHVIDYYKEKGLYEEYYQELEYVYARYAFCSSFLRIVKIKDKKIRNELLDMTWNNVNTKFPNWKNNRILKTEKSKKNLYLKSINKITYKIYSKIFAI